MTVCVTDIKFSTNYARACLTGITIADSLGISLADLFLFKNQQ